MARISAVKRRNAWRRAIRQVGVLFVAFGLGDFAFTIFRGKFEFLQALFLAVFLNVAGILAINYSIDTEEDETEEKTAEEIPVEKTTATQSKEVLRIDLNDPDSKSPSSKPTNVEVQSHSD